MAFSADLVEDALELRGVSSGLLEIWAERQEELNAATTRSSGTRLPAPIRTNCVRFMFRLMKSIRVSEQAWFEAAAVFDVFCDRSDMDEGELIGQAPAVCMAIARICAKRECERTGRLPQREFSTSAGHLAKRLGELGHKVGECSEESLDEAEIEVLTVLDWDIHILSLEMWTSFLHKRLEVVTRGMFKPTLDSASNWSSGIVRRVVLTTPYGDGALCARRMAEGLVASSLIFAGLLPESALRPQAMWHSEAEWLELLRGCTPAGTLPDCNIDESRASRFLHVLAFVTGSVAESIRESCAFACEVARDNWSQQRVPGANL